jgi:exonuclease VII large subunit
VGTKTAEPRKKDMPIGAMERRKAEELLRQRFSNLRTSLKNEVTDKKAEMRDIWERRSGVEKLRKKIKDREAELEQLKEQLEELVTENVDDATYGYYQMRKVRNIVGPLRLAYDRIETAERRATEKLDELEARNVEKLWFGMLSSDALALLEAVPTLDDMKKNGMSLLTMPAVKLLAVSA